MKSPAPLLSLNPSGTFGKTIVALRTKRGGVLQKHHKPGGLPSTAQLEVRERFFEAKEAWKALTTEEKEEYNLEAYDLHITGYNLFIRQFDGEDDMKLIAKDLAEYIVTSTTGIGSDPAGLLSGLNLPAGAHLKLFCSAKPAVGNDSDNFYMGLKINGDVVIDTDNGELYASLPYIKTMMLEFDIKLGATDEESIITCWQHYKGEDGYSWRDDQAGYEWPMPNAPITSIQIMGATNGGSTPDAVFSDVRLYQYKT